MFRLYLIITLVCCCQFLFGQGKEQLVLQGDYSSSDSIQIVEAYAKASLAVERMRAGMDEIWRVEEDFPESKQKVREKRWRNDPAFTEWLGLPSNLRTVRRRINRIDAKFGKRLILEVKKNNKGRCTGWISAWTIPFGKVKIRLCEDYFVYRTHLSEKVLIHEMGHEIGILFHRKVHGCRAARRAAKSNEGKVAKKSTENYAWLAVSYLGISCSSR